MSDILVYSLEDILKDNELLHFIETHPQATPFHTVAWSENVSQTLGHSPQWLVLKGGHGIEGVLPLICVKSPLFGTHLISTGLSVYGGPLTLQDGAREQLYEAALSLGRKQGVQTVEIRSLPQNPPLSVPPGWVRQEGIYTIFRQPLEVLRTAGERALEIIPRKKRADIRKGLSNPALSVCRHTPFEEFYRSYSRSLHQLGTPIGPRQFYAGILKAFDGKEGRPLAEVSAVYEGEEVLCTLMTFYWRGVIYPYYTGAYEKARGLHAHDVLYWTLMWEGACQGDNVFDFGRSKQGTGAYAYKKLWGMPPELLPYDIHLVKAKELPNLSPLNPKYHRSIERWKKLPRWVVETIGPWIAKGLG